MFGCPDNHYNLDDISVWDEYEETDDPDSDWRAHDADLPPPSEVFKEGE